MYLVKVNPANGSLSERIEWSDYNNYGSNLMGSSVNSSTIVVTWGRDGNGYLAIFNIATSPITYSNKVLYIPLSTTPTSYFSRFSLAERNGTVWVFFRT